MFSSRLNHSERTARANAIYQRALADQHAVNPLDPTQRLFARSGYGRISPPDAVFVPLNTEQSALSPPLIASGRMSRSTGHGLGHGITQVEGARGRDIGRHSPSVSATENVVFGQRKTLPASTASLPNRVPPGREVSAKKSQNPRNEPRMPGRQMGRPEADTNFDFEPFETAAVGPFFNWLVRAALAGGKLATRTGPKGAKPPRLGRSVKGAERQQNAKPNSSNPRRSSPVRAERSEVWKQRAAEATKHDHEGNQGPPEDFGTRRIEDVYLEIRDYLRKHPYLPDSFWKDHRPPMQITPGIRMTHDEEKASRGGGTYHRTNHYDIFGRSIGQTHRTHHGYPDPNHPEYHPNPHHHRRKVVREESDGHEKENLIRRKVRDGRKTKVWPGYFGNPWLE